VPVNVIQRQLGHANLGTIYLQGIDPEEIIATVHMRRAPMMSVMWRATALNDARQRERHRRFRCAKRKRACERDGPQEWPSSAARAWSSTAGHARILR
jgi:hypothetical protein